MMNKSELTHIINERRSFLSVGLDTDFDKIPTIFKRFDDPIFEYNKLIIEATSPFCVAYKLNTAFYEARGVLGWQSLEKTANILPASHFSIADAKRGDIGNTSKMYAKAFFETMEFDAITVAPYMGIDSVSPFLDFKGKWVILLAATSNPGAANFQWQKNKNGIELYKTVVQASQVWGTEHNLMYVVGATRPELAANVREIVPNHFLLIPGIGAQGGNLMDTISATKNKDQGILINSSRGIIYSPQINDDIETCFTTIQYKAKELQNEMEKYI